MADEHEIYYDSVPEPTMSGGYLEKKSVNIDNIIARLPQIELILLEKRLAKETDVEFVRDPNCDRYVALRRTDLIEAKARLSAKMIAIDSRGGSLKAKARMNDEMNKDELSDGIYEEIDQPRMALNRANLKNNSIPPIPSSVHSEAPVYETPTSSLSGVTFNDSSSIRQSMQEQVDAFYPKSPIEHSIVDNTVLFADTRKRSLMQFINRRIRPSWARNTNVQVQLPQERTSPSSRRPFLDVDIGKWMTFVKQRKLLVSIVAIVALIVIALIITLLILLATGVFAAKSPLPAVVNGTTTLIFSDTSTTINPSETTAVPIQEVSLPFILDQPSSPTASCCDHGSISVLPSSLNKQYPVVVGQIGINSTEIVSLPKSLISGLGNQSSKINMSLLIGIPSTPTFNFAKSTCRIYSYNDVDRAGPRSVDYQCDAVSIDDSQLAVSFGYHGGQSKPIVKVGARTCGMYWPTTRYFDHNVEEILLACLRSDNNASTNGCLRFKYDFFRGDKISISISNALSGFGNLSTTCEVLAFSFPTSTTALVLRKDTLKDLSKVYLLLKITFTNETTTVVETMQLNQFFVNPGNESDVKYGLSQIGNDGLSQGIRVLSWAANTVDIYYNEYLLPSGQMIYGRQYSFNSITAGVNSHIDFAIDGANAYLLSSNDVANKRHFKVSVARLH